MSVESTDAAERERILHDLHDTTGQVIFGIGLQLQDLLYEVEDPSTRKKLADLRALAAQGVSDIRSTMYALSFLRVRARGFVPALRALTRQFTRETTVPATLSVDGCVSRLPEDVEGALYRVAYEALTNVDRHARATGVVVRLAFKGSAVEMTICDDGVGIDQRHAPDWRSAAHFGIRTMERRVREVGGTFRVATVPPRGLLLHAAISAPFATARTAEPGGA